MLVAQSELSAVYGVSEIPRPKVDLPDRDRDPALSDSARTDSAKPDTALDELTGLAAVLCGAEFAYIGLIEMDPTDPNPTGIDPTNNAQTSPAILQFKSRHGFSAPSQPLAQTPFQWTIDSAAPLLISDAGFDPRFSPDGINLSGAGVCLSYAAVPLVDAAQRIFGNLAVLSAQPGRFKQEHLRVLEILGRQIVTRFELYNRIAAQEQAQRARMRTERALAVERSFVGVTLDSIPALIAVLDTAGRIVRLNDPCMQLTGLSLATAVGRPFGEEVLDDVDRAWTAACLREAAAGQVSGPHETSWRKRGIRSRRVSWTLRPLTGPGDGDGVQYLIVTGQDVTDRRDTEKALLSSENRLSHLVQNSLGFLFTCSLDGRLTSLNAFTAETLGYSMADLNGRQIADFLDPASAARFQDGLRLLHSGVEWQGVLRVRRSNGVYRRIAFRSRRMQLPDRQPFVLNHGMDVTEQNEAEEALRIETRQRELILESVGDGIFGIDLQGRLTFINEAAGQMLGYNPEQLSGLHVHDLTHPSHADSTPDSNTPYSTPSLRKPALLQDDQPHPARHAPPRTDPHER